MAGSRWYSAGACDFVAQPAAAITIKPPLGNLLPLRLLNVSDPTSNKASTAALSVVGYVVWPSLGLQQSCPAPAKASVAKPAAKKPVAKESAAKPAPVKESKLTAKLTEMKIALSASQLPAGISSIDVLNLGVAPHELVILKTDKPADSLGSESVVPEPGKIASGNPGHFFATCLIFFKLLGERRVNLLSLFAMVFICAVTSA